METLMLIFIVLGISSTFLALCSLIAPRYTAFFMKNPTTGKALYFWFVISLISSFTLVFLRSQI